MVVGVFPALKLGVLFVKQISKPIAKFLVNQAKNHPVFRTYFIIPPAQFYHWAEVNAKMYLMNLSKPTKVAKLNEAMAIELGANLMGEVIIFSVAGGCLILEYNRQVTKEAKKEEARLQQIQLFTNDIENLNQITSKQESEIQYLHEVIQEIAKHMKYEIVAKPKVKETNEQIQQSNINESQNSANSKSEKPSIIERAILYYENNVKTEKVS
ncbi:hypothetical protein WN51_04779 [Melipona quadrifasciata]|uniref:OPA3-like protein n=1 Tax=Melipona quadrifasciata TaxID=166423 RepID=A0A0M8ZUP6_9HYME|nr:hypothetical protein WN51_04779 [Melipona quadrifasciata]